MLLWWRKPPQRNRILPLNFLFYCTTAAFFRNETLHFKSLLLPINWTPPMKLKIDPSTEPALYGLILILLVVTTIDYTISDCYNVLSILGTVYHLYFPFWWYHNALIIYDKAPWVLKLSTCRYVTMSQNTPSPLNGM